ncbi:MAG: DNA polymerase III subunit gamma/tau [Caulobacterales bacterium]|nr:DNA polymerase III subunit gamma/tau [Caulobacterales bacterium]
MAESAPYQVLARKYRPQTFADLIGQEAMVRTLTNAFATGRIAHAFMLTGVRGVGKTTTARLLARALNYEPAEGEAAREAAGPTIELDPPGRHCAAIAESRHPDVMEMDAASRTGVGDIRELIEGVRYAPVEARHKVYIIDEVHMLSTAAFNALLKTLEEPPPHVKFIFATTEIRKLPVTVLSRCQRFDLRRIDAEMLTEHLAGIAGKEGVSIDREALWMIARAAEGSVRDALSILDQAIAHGEDGGGDKGAGVVTAELVQGMLGLADRSGVIELFEAVAAGRTADALDRIADLHEAGADPAVVLTDLAVFTHFVTRLKVSPAAAKDPVASEAERVRGAEFAEKLSLRVLSRMWQMLAAGIEETAEARMPRAAADMVLVRLCHAADLPTPDEALRQLRQARDTAPMPSHSAPSAPGPSAPAPGAPEAGPAAPAGLTIASRSTASVRSAPAAETQPEPVAPEAAADQPPMPATFDELVALARSRRDRLMVFALERHVVPLKVEPGRLDIAITAEAEADLPHKLAAALNKWTGSRWIVSVGALPEDGTTRHDERRASREAELEAVRAEPLVAQALETFPGARIVSVRAIELDRGGDGEPGKEGAE